MSRTKKVSFTDAADIFLETASATEVRDLAVMVATYARARKLSFKVTVTDMEVKQLALREGATQATLTPTD